MQNIMHHDLGPQWGGFASTSGVTASCREKSEENDGQGVGAGSNSEGLEPGHTSLKDPRSH